MSNPIRPGITAAGYRTAVKDYTENTVVEELAANSYDADASVVVVLLDAQRDLLYVIDNGRGFNEGSIQNIATLGGGDKQDAGYSSGHRHYLGSYGYGLKSSMNIANRVEVKSYGEDGAFDVMIDWGKLDDALKESFPGFPVKNPPVGKD